MRIEALFLFSLLIPVAFGSSAVAAELDLSPSGKMEAAREASRERRAGKGMRIAGATLMAAGSAATACSIFPLLVSIAEDNPDRASSNGRIGAPLLALGQLAVGVAIPLLVFGKRKIKTSEAVLLSIASGRVAF